MSALESFDQPKPESACGPTLSLTRYIEGVLAPKAVIPNDFAFAVLADIHLRSAGALWFDEVLRELLQRSTDAGAAFIVVVGDLGKAIATPRGSDLAWPPEVFVETIGSVDNCPPVFFTIGNHDRDGAGKAAWLQALYPEVVPGLEGTANQRFFYFSFNCGAGHFVCLDAHGKVEGHSDMRESHGTSHFAHIPDEEFAWLEEDLEKHRGRPTFVFMHEPTEQIEHHRPWHLLHSRGRLIGTLERFPDVQWLFHGHTHHHSQVRAWGLNICHLGKQRGQFVRVRDGGATLHELDDQLSQPSFVDLAALHQNRWRPDAGRRVFQVAPDGPEVREWDRPIPSLFAQAEVLAEDGSVTPPDGGPMIRVQAPLKAKKTGEVADLAGYLAMDFILEIRPGTTFSYAVYCDPFSVHDHFSLAPLINTRDGRAYPLLRDQEGLLIDTEPERPLDGFYSLGPSDGAYCAPSLQGRAQDRWYQRVCDLSFLAGGWMVGVVACATPPPQKDLPTGYLKFYLSAVEVSWPKEA